MRPRAVADMRLKECCFLVLLVLPWLAMASAFTLPADFYERVTMRTRSGPQQQIRRNSPHKRLRTSPLRSRMLAANASAWNTLDGSQPLVIARGGSSGMFPDQTAPAYLFAATFTTRAGGVLMCDMQLTKDATAICRTGIDLGLSTNIATKLPNLNNTYNVNGQIVQGYFAIDLTSTQALSDIMAVQSNPARTPGYDNEFNVSVPEDVAFFANNSLLIWINVEYANFYTQHKLDMSSALLALMTRMPVDFISSPEIAFLKAIKAAVPKNTPNLVLEFHGMDDIEPTTNVTYGSLLTDLKTVATYASGILVPKEYIWPVNNLTFYLEAETSLVREAHAAGLAIYGSEFVNDPISPIYNYSFDPTREYLQYVSSKTGSSVDGFLTDFPTTGSEALECFRSAPTARKAGSRPYVISHNGDSGNFPGCTILAYASAVRGGASYIDCPVQMTSDGVPICRESPNLLISTNAATQSSLLTSRTSTIPQLQSSPGLYTFNLTWAEIQGLKAKMYSPEDAFGIDRNPAYTQESIISLAEFLNFTKNTSVGILVDIQNGYFLETEVGLNVVGAVLASLNKAGLNNSNRVIVQSEDSAVLRRIQQTSNYTLVYRATATNILVTKAEVAEVKALANYVTLQRGLIQGTTSSFLTNMTNIVDLFHAQNISVFVFFLRNEFVTLPFDYESDPILELNTFVQVYNVDGLITDFPATASAYLSNSCLKPTSQYEMRLVIPGDLLTNLPPSIPAPAPPATQRLNVSEGEEALPPITLGPLASPPPSSSPTPRAPPTPTPGSAPPTSANTAASSRRGGEPSALALLVAALWILVCHFQ